MAHITSMSITPSILLGGAGPIVGAVVTALFNEPVPAGGDTLYVASAHPTLVTVPATVELSPGATSATFTASMTNTATPVDVQVPIYATLDGQQSSVELAVRSPVVTRVQAVPSSVIGSHETHAVVTLNGIAPPEGIVVSLASSNPDVFSVPTSITIPEGVTTGEIPVTPSAVASPTPITITAQKMGDTRAFPETCEVMVLPPALASLAIAPTVIQGGASGLGTVTLNGTAPSGGALIALASSDPTVATVPSSVLVPAGQSVATFPVTGQIRNATKACTITATYGSGSFSRGLTVVGIVPVAVSIAPNAVTGGASATATVTLSSPAQEPGLTVTLSDRSPYASAPATLTFPAGAMSASAPVTTTPPPSSVTVNINASLNGRTAAGALQINP